MDLHQRQKDNKFVFSKPTIIEGGAVNNIDETQPTLTSKKSAKKKSNRNEKKTVAPLKGAKRS